MTSQTKIKYALLAEWLRSLEAEGYTFGVDKRLQFQSLLNKLPEETTFNELKLLLTPLIAQNEQEQSLVYSIFERALKRVEAIHKIEEEITLPEIKKLWWLNPLIALLALLTALLALFLLKPDVVEIEEPHATKFFGIAPSSTDTICLDSSDLSIYEDLSRPIQYINLCQSELQVDSSSYGTYTIGDDLCLIYTAKDSLGQDSICVQFIDSEQDTFFAYFNPVIEEQNITDTIIEETPLASTVSFQVENYPIETDIHSLQIEPLTPFEQFYLNNEWWLRLLFYILSAIITLLILLVRERNRRQLVAEVQNNDQVPNIWNVETGETPNIQLEEEYDLLLNNLRQRTTADQRVFDVPKTIQATIDKGGMTNFQYRFRTRPPEYLLLINQRSRDNHRARWYDHLYHYFLEHEVLVDRFFYDEDPRLCWNETYVDGLKLKDLQQLHPEARLMLVGTGYSLLNPLTGKSAKWTKVFSLWKERAIFSPTPTADWGRKERLLEQNFVMLPTSMQALQFYVSQLELGSEAEFGNWKNQVEDAHEYGIKLKPELGNIPMQLNIHYDESVVKWIAACAVYPSLHWDLSMRLGDLLSEGEQPLLTSENISALNRLPWFTEGEIPDEIRANLIEWLENEHPETLEKVRFELHNLLQQNPPPKDSIAWEDYHLNTSFNEWLITVDNKRKKQLEEEIARDLAKGTEPDFTVIKYLDRPKSPLDFVVPDTWKKHVYNGGFSGLGFKGLGTDIFWAIPTWLLACFLVWFVEPNITEQCEGDLASNLLLEVDGRQFTFPDNSNGTGIGQYQILPSKNSDSINIVSNRPSDAVLIARNLGTANETDLLGMVFCIDQPSDKILLGEYTTRFGIVAKDSALVDSMTTYVQEVYETINGDVYPEEKQLADSLWNGYRKNLSVDYWNYAIPLFEEWDSLKLLSDKYYEELQRGGNLELYELSDSINSLARSVKREACFYFERAWQLDSLNEDRIDAQLWCEERTYNVQIEIASSRQVRLANQVQTILEQNDYNLQETTTEASIRTSEIIYFYEEDRAFAYRLLLAVKNILVDTDLQIKQEAPPVGPGEPRKGEIVIRLADQTVLPPPPINTGNQVFTLAFYAYQYSNTQYQAVDSYLKSEGYDLSTSTLSNTPFKIDGTSSVIFYYSDQSRNEATQLSNNLEKRFGYKFRVQRNRDTKQLSRRLDRNKFLAVYLIKEEAQTSRFPILNGIRLNRISRNPNIQVQWLSPKDSKIENNEAQYRIELGVTSNQALAVGNMWIEHNGRILENREDNVSDQNTRKAIRYTYGYNRTIDLMEGNNLLKFLVINESQEVVEESSSINIVRSNQSSATGRTVNMVAYGTSKRENPLGYFRKINENTWVEEGAIHEERFQFEEQRRDASSVYLWDASRSIAIQINLIREQIIYTNSQPSPNSLLYTILSASTSSNITRVPNNALPSNILYGPNYDIELYFDNEQPSAKSNSTYDELYTTYLNNRYLYIENISTNSPKATSPQQLQTEVNDFFQNTLDQNYKDFQQALAQMQTYLEQGYELQICLQASVAAGGISSYNNQLMDRRIKSIERSISTYNGGRLTSYLRSGALVIQELPAVGGDSETSKVRQLEEERDYSGRGAYDLLLAQERKVTITTVGRKGANCTN